MASSKWGIRSHFRSGESGNQFAHAVRIRTESTVSKGLSRTGKTSSNLVRIRTVQETLGSNSNRIHRLHRPSRTGNPWFEFEPSFPAPERDLVGAQAASTLRYREIQLSAYRESSDLLRRTLECARGASARRACCGGNGARFEVRCGAAIAPSLTSISEASARTWPRG